MPNYTLAAATGAFALTGSSAQPALRITLSSTIGVTSTLVDPRWTAHVTTGHSIKLVNSYTLGFGQQLAESIALGSTLNRQYRGGALIAEVIRLTPSLDPSGRFHVSRADAMLLVDKLRVGLSAQLTSGIGVHEVVNAVRALQIMESLAISHTSSPNMRFRAQIAELISLHSVLGRFFGGELHESIGFAPSTNLVYRGHPVLADGIGLHDVLGQRLIWRVIEEDTIGFDDDQVLKAIYHAHLQDVIQLSTAYVSPGGGLTTWAMNTRTGAVTEYTDYTFNSFARMGASNLYVGANANGLFELDGDTNDGTKIIADIMSGFAQFAGSKFTAFQAAYLGIRGKGTFYLKLETGDGRSYTYKVEAQSMLTTRVNLGKGLRARYFSFELTNTGQDFDLESISFIPITSKRRI